MPLAIPTLISNSSVTCEALVVSTCNVMAGCNGHVGTQLPSQLVSDEGL